MGACAGVIGYLIGFEAGKNVRVPDMPVLPLPAPLPRVVREIRHVREATPAPLFTPAQADAISALVNFGYARAQVVPAVRSASAQADETEEIIRLAHRALARPTV